MLISQVDVLRMQIKDDKVYAQKESYKNKNTLKYGICLRQIANMYKIRTLLCYLEYVVITEAIVASPDKATPSFMFQLSGQTVFSPVFC